MSNNESLTCTHVNSVPILASLRAHARSCTVYWATTGGTAPWSSGPYQSGPKKHPFHFSYRMGGWFGSGDDFYERRRRMGHITVRTTVADRAAFAASTTVRVCVQRHFHSRRRASSPELNSVCARCRVGCTGSFRFGWSVTRLRAKLLTEDTLDDGVSHYKSLFFLYHIN